MANPGSDAAASAARHSARAILAEPRFHSLTVPRPLHGALRDIGRVLEAPLDALDELVSKLAVSAPGGSATVWAVVILIGLGVGALLSTRGARRALSGDPAGASGSGATPAMTAEELEREAAAAERDGRYTEAVRCRFQAGLRRLTERELVSDVPGQPNGEIARALRSPAFDSLAGRFDEIVYGGANADEQDARHSRREWERLLGGAGRP